MIDANSKSNSFIKAIEKYANEQQNAMRKEIEDFRREQLHRANEEGTAAAYAFIQKEKAEFKLLLAKDYSAKETAMKKEVFDKRQKMVASIFEEAEKRIISYSKSEKYTEYMLNAANKIHDLVGDKNAIVYIAEKDSGLKNDILNILGENAEIFYDNTIELGGIKCYCEEMSIVADETLDNALAEQRQQFIEKSKFIIKLA